MLDMSWTRADRASDTVKQQSYSHPRTHYNIRGAMICAGRLQHLARLQVMADARPNRPPQLAKVEQPALSEPVQPVEAAVEVEESAPAAEPVPAVEPAKTVIHRRVPVPVLRPRLDLCLPSGFTLDAGSRILVVADSGKTADGLARRLRSRKASVLVVNPVDEIAMARIEQWHAESPVTGIYYLPALDIEPALAEMDAGAWESELDKRVMPLYHLLRKVGPESFLVCATRMGGLHGYGADGAAAPLGGAVSGFAKAIAMERPKLFVKVVDFAEDEIPSRMAGLLIQETLVDNAVVEVGWRGEQRFGIALLERPAEAQTLDLGKKPVFLVSGGTGGITASVVTDLAKNTQGTFYLLGRAENADPRIGYPSGTQRPRPIEAGRDAAPGG